MSIDKNCRHRGSDEGDAPLLGDSDGAAGEGEVVIGGEESDQAEHQAADGLDEAESVKAEALLPVALVSQLAGGAFRPFWRDRSWLAGMRSEGPGVWGQGSGACRTLGGCIPSVPPGEPERLIGRWPRPGAMQTMLSAVLSSLLASGANLEPERVPL